ncbi:MAG TPA: hypothetical protein EYH09_00230 [Candidatus Nanopusillus sp.]|nr:hypothetical protein [Candidatus Nanopusillus sp.]HIP90354.1 hypothetical protein [Candidatus Nanopusillus sp.]
MLPTVILLEKIKDITDNNEIIKIAVDINNLKIQGAKEVALESIHALEIYYSEKGFDEGFFKLLNLLQNLRPTQVITYNVLNIIKKSIGKKGSSIFTILKSRLISAQEKINKNLLTNIIELGKNRLTIMTHCHSSEEIRALIFAKQYGIDISAYVTETRPKYQGIKTAKELAKAGVKVRYIVDSAAGFYMKKVDISLFGCDSIKREGIINKIGTYMISLVSKEHNKEVWFVGDILKVDLRKEVIIEMRDPTEIIDPELLPGVRILNPAFDITPWKLVDKVITDVGTYRKFVHLKNEFNRVINSII